MSKESFKSFARSHPEFINYVLEGKTNWQKLYELYQIYGENSSIWNDYFSTRSENKLSYEKDSLDLSNNIKELVNNVKNIDLTSVQKGINNIQKALGLLQDIGLGQNVKEPYEPRPIYKHFDD